MRSETITVKFILFLQMICFLIIGGICCLVVRTWNLELSSLVGAISVNDNNGLITAVQDYFSSDTSSKDTLSEFGYEVFKDAGYSFSANRVIFRNCFFKIIPLVLCAFSVLIASFVMLCLLLISYKKSGKQYDIKMNLLKAENAALKKEISSKIDEIGMFEENLYHQLKTPITSVQLAVDEMRLTIGDSVCSESAYKAASLQIQKLSRLVSLFLRDRKISSNMVKFNYRQEDLLILLEDAICQLQLLFESREIKTLIDNRAEDCIIYCDSNWIRECFITILENCGEYSLNGSTVPITISQDNKNIYIVIESSSSISKEETELAFTRFYSNKAGHFGIGLHMARNIIIQHHGKLTLTTNNDDKAEFLISFPILS